MVYTQERLDEALQVLKTDCARIRKEQEEKYAQTHYRDDFQLRKHKRMRTLRPLYQEFDTNADDDDYCPDESKQTKRRKQNSRNTGGDKVEVQSPKRKKPVDKAKILQPNLIAVKSGKSANVFATFRLYQERSLQMMENLSFIYNTGINVYLEEHEPAEIEHWAHSGASIGRLSSSEELRKLAEQVSIRNGQSIPQLAISADIEEATIQTRQLRNGKIRTTTAKGKKFKRSSLRRAKRTKGKAVAESDTELLDTPAIGIRPSQALVSSPGSSPPNAICIDDDSTDQTESDNDASTNEDETPKQPDIIDLTDVMDDIHEVDPDAAEIITIKTCFAHPIDFQSKPGECDFCTDYRFGIVGHRLLNVTVARNHNGGMIELGNGHAQFHAPTRMCISCALDRMAITRCLTHQMVQYTSPPSNKEMNAYAHDLVRKDNTRPANPPHPITSICSICPHPGQYKCTCLQKVDRTLNPVRDERIPLDQQQRKLQTLIQQKKANGLPHDYMLKPPIYGCGLVLCEKCKNTLELNGGRLQNDVVAAAESRNDAGMARGDVEFLFRDGALWRAYNPSRLNSS